MTPLSILKAGWERWKVIAHAIGTFQSRVILSVFYFVVVGPFAVVARAVSDPLRIGRGHSPAWLGREPASGDSLITARRQF